MTLGRKSRCMLLIGMGMLLAAFPFSSTSVHAAPPYPVFIPLLYAPTAALSISEVLYDGTRSNEGDEFVELYNSEPVAVDLDGYKIGDEEIRGGSEGMYRFPAGANIPAKGIIVIARNALEFRARFGRDPDFEMVTTGTLTDTPHVPNLIKYPAWSGGALSLANTGDEVLLLGPADVLVDSAAWSDGNFDLAGLRGDARADAPESLQRYATFDTNNMSLDFLHGPASPGALVVTSVPRPFKPPAPMPGGMYAYWGDLHAHSTVSDGSGPPRQAYETARAAGLHFFALTDHDDRMTPEVWNAIDAAAREATVDNVFVGVRGFEYTHPTDGHLSVYNSATWVSYDDANYDTLPEIYAWLSTQIQVLAQFNHPSAGPGTNFNDFAFDAAARDRIVLQEVGNNGDDTGYVRYDTAYVPSLSQGWHVAPANNSDHHKLQWGTDSPHRTGVLLPALTHANLLEALRSRRVFSTEDEDLAIALQANGVWMGSAMGWQPTVSMTITTSDHSPMPVTLTLYDNGAPLWTESFPASNLCVSLSVAVNRSHYYYVGAVQSNGALAYTAPIWFE